MNYIITCIIDFFLDLLKPHLYYISTGLRGSILHGDFSLMNSLAQWEADWQMKFNVAKCHSMRVTRHPPDKHIQFEYTLHQQRLEQVQSAKYLGITISDDLDWGQHISEISSKATKTLGFLRRNLAFAPRHTKEVAYKTLVRPKL